MLSTLILSVEPEAALVTMGRMMIARGGLALELLKRMAVSGLMPNAHLRASWGLLVGCLPWHGSRGWPGCVFWKPGRGSVECKLKLVSGAILVHFRWCCSMSRARVIVIDALEVLGSLEICFMGLKF